MSEGLVDFGEGEVVACASLMAELLEMIEEDAEALGCVKDVQHVKTVLKRGTSADRQVKVFETAKTKGKIAAIGEMAASGRTILAIGPCIAT